VVNWNFIGWTGDATGSSPAITVTMDHDKSVQAEFTHEPGIAPTITAQPASQTVSAWQDATLTVVAAGTTPLSYQWRKDLMNLSGATSASLALTKVQLNQAGNYVVVITNSYGSVTSSVAVLTVNAPPPGTVVAWGYNGFGQTTVPAGLSGVTAIAAGDGHTVV